MRLSTLSLFSKCVLLPSLIFATIFTLNVQARASTEIMLAQAPQEQPPQPTQPTLKQRAAMIKFWLQESQKQIRAYEWIETTVISKSGEEKSRTQKRCYYGLDGKLQKVVLQTESAPEGGPPGILPFGRLIKRAAEHEKEETTEYMHKAEELVHSYIPPVPGLIQQSINAGKMGIQVLDPGHRARLTFGDYLKPGDSLGFEIELPTNRLLGVAVSTYIDTAEDPVTLNVTMSVLPDGTIYAERSVLDASAKEITVTIENTGYRRLVP